MEIKKLTPYVLQGLAVGFLGGFIILLFFKSDPTDEPQVVEFKEVHQSQSATPSNQQNSTGVSSYAAAVDNAAPSVVNVFTTKIVTQRRNPLFDDPIFQRFFGNGSQQGQRKRLENSLGSGVIISEQGYVLTNNHVIKGADEILVALQDGRAAKAKVVGADPDTDIAVLQIPADNLTAITIGQSDTLRVGDVVLAIGNPFGVGQTVTMGIVSATGRSQLGISTIENFIQTDAAINPGNSGGALVNAYGQLVGINTAIFSRSGGSQGIGFAIPTKLAKKVMTQIIQHGRAIRGWLGIEVQDITPALAESFNMKDNQGVLIAGILRNGPADQAGIKPGDIITQVNGKKIRDSANLINSIAEVSPQEEVRLNIVRNQETLSVTAIVAERPKLRQRQQ